MNTEKIKTLEQVHDALDNVEEARAKNELTQNEKKNLESASVQLRNIERAIVRAKTDEMVNALTNDTKALKELAEKIKVSADKLKKTAEIIEKTAKITDAFITIATTAASSGLI